MESLCPVESDRASEVSFCLEDVTPESVLNSEETEDLTRSFKEAVNAEEVKPKLQCLMSNPAFSMVTVQCEDSGIHWETSSSRCSTPWASEASTTSEVFSMESLSAGTPPGKVIFIMDEGKLRRKRVRPSTSAKFARQSAHHKKSTENPKASADNMEESLKQALEKAKRHLSTHTEEAGNTDSAGKNTEDCTEGNPNVPEKDLGSEAKPPDEKTKLSTAEASNTFPDKVAEDPTGAVPGEQRPKLSVFRSSFSNIIPYHVPDKMLKPSESNGDCEGAAMSPKKSVPEKKTVPETVKPPPQRNTTKPKGRVPQSLAENRTEMISSKHDIDSYPPFVLVELRSILDKIDILCNPEKAAAQKDTNDAPNTQSNVFSIVSDGSEILNILAPELISSVDQEASQEMEDKLEYLEENPLLIPKQPCPEELSSSSTYEEPVQMTVQEETSEIIQLDKTVNDVDYFEKFTLVDSTVPKEPGFQCIEQETVEVKGEQYNSSNKSESSFDDDSYLLQSLDESFYGVSLDHDATIFHQEPPIIEKSISDEIMGKKDKEVKTNGLTLFGEEGVLTKSFFFPTSYPVNPELLAEPPALAFLYSDLYEEARGGKTNKEHDQSDAESTSSVESFHSRISDDDGTGIYFEKFNLKDEIPPGDEKSDDDDFYSDEGSEEEQYLSYEALSQGSLADKEISVEDKKSPSLPNSVDHVQNVAVKKSLGDKQKKVMENHYQQREKKLLREDAVLLNDRSDLVNDTYKVPSTDIGPISRTTEWKRLGDKETAEDLDYFIVSPDDLDEDDVSLKEITFEDQESLEHESDLFLDAVQISPEHEESGFEMVEHETKSEDVLETSISEERKAQLDTYCNMCKIPIVAFDKVFGDHKDHDVTTLDAAVNEMTCWLAYSWHITTGTGVHGGLDVAGGARDDGSNFASSDASSGPSEPSYFLNSSYRMTTKLQFTKSTFSDVIIEPSSLLLYPKLRALVDKTLSLSSFDLCATQSLPDSSFGLVDSKVSRLIMSNLEYQLEKLQEKSLKTEDFVTRVEALFNDVEKNFSEAEKMLTEENEKNVQKVIDHHKKKREASEEVKKMKMDYLYDQMVSFQQSVDLAKEVLEKVAKELDEQDPVMLLSVHNDINSRLLKAMENTVSLDKMPSAFSLFDHTAAKSSKADQKTVRNLPVPQTPKLQPQEHNSATSTSITVYWTMSEEDIIDCFQVYCMEEPQGKADDNGLLEEYRVTVKESLCILEDLEPDKSYSVWVMAVNYTGCSLPSDKSIFRTAPSTPVIKAEECTVCWDMAVIRWSTAHLQSTESFTLEWCKQCSSEGEGLRSVAGIKDQQLRVSLQPGENYFFYVKATNTFGSSEQSEAALISTKGTRFHLLRDTAHPAVELSSDGTVISISEQSDIDGIPLVLGELLPAKGYHYWEMMVTECSSYSVGATFHPSPEESATTEDSTSWCMQCSSSSTSYSYRFLHKETWSEVYLTEPPVRVGILLDYKKGRLSFYNVQKGQLLFTFRHKFTEAAHPTFALEGPGEIHLHTGIELPQFAKQS
ncbi:cardiomyopathy-associated protein 5 [Hyla sarda]|uniref:cardiomyopathy-associated protein 5 n=1 Tax=Hyla sarda TaxID=327740 RepID=UPI0024C40B11|nr:cardiomyopathy-associated protein 5 [Hyla sarda]